MKKRLLLLLPLSISLLIGGKIKPKVIDAKDSHRHYDQSSSHHRSNGQDDVLSSTFEVTSEISILISSEASSDITSHRGHSNARIVHFLEENRIDITTDMAKSEGEYITTLLHIMNLKHNASTLSKIQINFDQFIDLSTDDFLIKLREISINA